MRNILVLFILIGYLWKYKFWNLEFIIGNSLLLGKGGLYFVI